MATTRTTFMRHVPNARWLWALLVLLGGLFTPAEAQTRDVITITSARVGAADAGGDFKKGAASTEYQGVYVIDVGDMPVISPKDEDGNYEPQFVTVTLSRPLGATAKRAATVKLGNMRFWGDGPTVTFEPGETTKTVEIAMPANEPSDSYEDENGEWHDLFTWSGNLPEIYTITTTYADAEYDLLMLKVNRTGADAPRQSTFATKLEVLQNTFGNDHANYRVERWGDYILFRFFLATDVKIGNDSRYVINARFADHTGMGPDDDDFGMAQMHEVELHPINAGSVCSEAWYIYRPTPDEYLHSYPVNLEYPEESGRAVEYPVLEVGPFEVANPAEDAVKFIFYSRADLPEESANSLFGVYFEVDGLRPEFSNVRINKTAFKSGETMVITANMDNWQFVKRCQNGRFRSSFGVTLNDNESLEPGRYTFDEKTGQVTYYVTAPTVTETKTIYVDFGPACRIAEGNLLLEKSVQTSAERSFVVTVSPEAVTPNPITEFDIPGLPVDGSLIVLKKTEEDLGMFILTHVDNKTFAIDPIYSPLNATNANQISYSVTNAGGANAAIINNGLDGISLTTGVNDGSFTFTASIGDEVKFSRTYTLMAKVGDEDDALAMPEPLNHSNKYFVGTVFPQFQFELKNPDNRPVDDAITVNYTHANGLTWTETYSLKALKSRESDRKSTIYDLPFSFTDEHPDVTDDSQIGQAVITAKVLISVPTTDGPKETIECTAMLVSDLKKISFGDYSEMTTYYNDVHPVTLTSEVMYLPRMGFTVGYEIPELGLKETYNSLTDGENVPDWLELQANDYYYTANITLHPTPDQSISRYNFFTLAQRSYNADEVMLRELTSVANFLYVGAEGHIVYKIDGEDATGDLTLDNTEAIEQLLSTIESNGYYQDVVDESSQNDPRHKPLISPLHLPRAVFEVNDDFYEGANITLKCGEDVIQTLNGYKGKFFFQPPSDGKTYLVEVYFPGYGRRYTNTFKSYDLSNLYHFNTVVVSNTNNAPVKLKFTKDGQPVTIPFGQVTGTYGRWSRETYTYYTTTYHDNYLKGIVRMDNPANCYLSLGDETIRLSLQDYISPLKPDVVPELWYSGYAITNGMTIDVYNHLYSGVLGDQWRNYIANEKQIWWDDLSAANTQVTVVNSEGEPITDATLHYACVDGDMACQVTKGTATYESNFGYYQVSTDPYQYAELIEVVPTPGSGYEPVLTTMYLWNYDYNSRENKGKQRRHTIVLQKQDNQINNLVLETFKREGNLKDNKMDVAINLDDLLSIGNSATLNYSQTADYENAIKHLPDPKFGSDGWTGTKYAHVIGCMPYQTVPDLTLATADGSWSLQPTQKLLTTDDFPFSTNYCLFDFDLTDKIAPYTTVQPVMKNGTETVATLPSLRNQTVDLMALNEANKIEMEPGGIDLTKVDDQASANGVNMKDSGKAFDNFNFQMPPVLPFTVSIERNGDYFTIRAVCEKNFIPGGKIMDALDKLEDLQYFDEQFQACMDAVNSAQPADDDFFDDIPRWPSAFVGIKGYLSGIGYYNHDTDQIEFNFLEGGLTFEASAQAQANLSFGIGGFGMSIDAKMAMTMGLVNTAAEMGNVSRKATQIDFVFDYQTRLKVCAWAYAGIDIWIAKAVVGVRGGACIDLHHRAYVRKGLAGMKTTLQAQMEAFAEVRFLFFKKKKSWSLLRAKKEYLVPNNPSNPFHPENDEPIFSSSRQNVTKSYKKLKRKVIADLGTPIISNVSGMARPTYLIGGTSLLFNNLNTPSDYNDDRLQVFAGNKKNDLVSTGIDAPMYDFSAAHNNYFELITFEQLANPVDGNAIDAMTETDQTKTVSENSRIHVAWRTYEAYDSNTPTLGDWYTEQTSDASDNIACVNPITAVAAPNGLLYDATKGAVVWQQGVPKFNDEGNRYIDGSLMLKRYTYGREEATYAPRMLTTEPIEIKRLNRRNVPADYQMAFKDDSVLVMMALQQDVDNQNKSTSLVFVSVSPDDKVRERYTMIEGTKPQMVNVNNAILVAYLQQNQDGRDLVLNTVNMKGETTGKVTGPLGMNRRMVNDYKLLVEAGDASLSTIALLWSQSDEERTENADGTTTVLFKNRIYASKLCSNDKQLYFSAPIEIATMPDDVNLVSMDGYLDGLDMKVAYCVANDDEGAAVLETNVAFINAIDHKISFNPYEVTDNDKVPVTITVVNNGFEPINSIEVTMGEQTSTHEVSLMPQETTDLSVLYPVTPDFDGSIDYSVVANFIPANTNSLKIRRMAAARPRRIQQSGTQMNVRQVDMAVKVLSKRTDADGVTTVVAEVNNASLLPLASGMSVKVGLYDSPLATEKADGTTEVTVSASDLYDADSKENKVKIVTLTATQPDFAETLFLRTTPMQGTETLTDVRPSNNVLPVSLVGKYLLGDANSDKKVTIADVTATINHINGNTPAVFVQKAANVNKDASITISDVTGVINIINK